MTQESMWFILRYGLCKETVLTDPSTGGFLSTEERNRAIGWATERNGEQQTAKMINAAKKKDEKRHARRARSFKRQMKNNK